MIQKGGSRSQRRPILFFSLAALVTLASVTGCDHGVQNYEDVLNNDLVKRTDKFFDVAHVSGNTFVIVGYNGRIMRSEDNGVTWTDLERPVPNSLTQVSFVGEHGWAVGHSGVIVHSRDGGKTWTPQNANTKKTLFAVSFVDQNHGWACGDESTWLWTDNGGETWNAERMDVSQVGLSEDTSLAIPDLIYYSVQFIDQNNGWIVGEYGNVRHTSDGGKTWDSQHESLLSHLPAAAQDVMTLGAWFRVNFTDLNNGMLVGAGGAVAVTSDGGKNWEWIAREGNNPSIPPVHMYTAARPGVDGHIIMTGTNGIILHSEDNGRNWQPAKAPGGVFTWINGVAFSPEGKGVLVGGKGLILLSDDAGLSWRAWEEKKA
ncbi:MAG: WD40/YVTN/BNR-like repeat-containing protein [Candidatus Binatia bacterium]